jgi:hypothetical protein
MLVDLCFFRDFELRDIREGLTQTFPDLGEKLLVYPEPRNNDCFCLLLGIDTEIKK